MRLTLGYRSQVICHGRVNMIVYVIGAGLAYTTLLPISEFVLNEKFQRNASKFAIYYIYENPKFHFPFYILCNFKFFTY